MLLPMLTDGKETSPFVQLSAIVIFREEDFPTSHLLLLNRVSAEYLYVVSATPVLPFTVVRSSGLCSTQRTNRATTTPYMLMLLFKKKVAYWSAI